MTTFYRLLKDTDKATALRTAVTARRSGDADAERTFTVDPAAFSKVPNTPFAYWVDDEIRDLFVKLPPFESDGRTVRVGLQTSDDFRFVRAWWEVDPVRRLDPGLGGAPDWREDVEGFQAWCRRRTHEGKGWAPFAKGGEYSPYYSDIHLVVNWEREGEEIKNFVDPKTGKQNSRPQNTDYYFRPGVTWSYLPKGRGFFGQLPAGSVFGHGGNQISGSIETIVSLMAYLNSRIYLGLLHMQMARGLGLTSATLKYEVGYVRSIPVPSLDKQETAEYVTERFERWKRLCASLETDTGYSATSSMNQDRSDTPVDDALQARFEDGLAKQVGLSVTAVRKLVDNAGIPTDMSPERAIALGTIQDAGIKAKIEASSCFANAFARWDIRLALNPELVPALPDPFDPLPVVPPATLVGPDGLPATSGNIVSEEWLRARPNAITLPPAGSVTTPTITDDEYPIPIPWDGILVDDPDHPADIVARIQKVLEILHGERFQQVEEELCGELGVDNLREYIANPKGFFTDHLSRYSKSRRKAPIYWPLSTPSGGWTAWLYYPRLTDATIYTLIERYLHPRLELARQLYEEVARIPAASRSPGQQRQFDLSSRDKDELAAMEEELKRIAAMPYRVDHDDGVPILAAPFAGMFRHREWATYLTGIREKLEAGEYDWAHLAYAIWPERVREKARDDRSIAIAHGIEEAQ